MTTIGFQARLGRALTACMMLGVATMAPAQSGDAAAGERVYRQCAVCHDVVAPSGQRLAGRGASAGPNLYGILGQRAGRVAGFRYSADLVQMGASGLVWNRRNLADYLHNPTGFTRAFTGNPMARSNMSYRLNAVQEAADVVAYLDRLAQ